MRSHSPAELAKNDGVESLSLDDFRVQGGFRITLVGVKVQPPLLEHGTATRTHNAHGLAVGGSSLPTPLTTAHFVGEGIHEKPCLVVHGRLGTTHLFFIQVIDGF